MPREDAVRWNERYRTAPDNWYAQPRSILTQNVRLLDKTGLALDVAMGMGSNADFLEKMGWRVVGVDIAERAVFHAKSNNPHIQAVIADLAHFRLPIAAFDLVLNFYYLDRSLWPVYRQTLKQGGLLIVETLLQDTASFHPDANPAFYLSSGELLLAFNDWDILHYFEGKVPSDHGREKSVASLIARRPQISSTSR